jgi:hypothetical protein
MIIFSFGIAITLTEQQGLHYLVPDVEQWVRDLLSAKCHTRGKALIEAWRPRLFADPTVTSLPANEKDLVALIVARPDYRSRLQADAEEENPELPTKHNIARFNGTAREGMDLLRPERDPTAATEVLFPDGLLIDDADAACILAYVQDLEDWVLGALLGQINRGKKKMIAKYQPAIMADPSVVTMPATEDGLITMILARSDYQRLGG